MKKKQHFPSFSVSQKVNMMLSGTPARFLVEVALHGQAVVPAAGKDHCHHPGGQEKPSQGAAGALLLKTLSLLTLAGLLVISSSLTYF